jgi:uncharacterized protein
MIARFSTRQIPTRQRQACQVLAALVALALVVVAKPVAAQGPAANPNPSPSAILLAKEIIELKGARETIFNPLVRGVIEKTKDTFMQTNFMWSKDLNEVAANMEKEYASKTNELEDQSARIYAGYFTETELRQILAFYKSPVGQKVITDEPKALDKTIANAGQFGDSLSDEVMAKMREEMKKRGHDL